LELVLKEAGSALKQVGGLAGKIDKETVPQVQTTIKELQKTLIGLQQAIGKDAPLNYNARKALEELTETLRAVRELADTLENRPQAIIFGKEGEKNHE
jgi:paraquat-inducible protein B